MKFQYPYLLIVAALVLGVLIFVFIRSEKIKKQKLNLFIGEKLQKKLLPADSALVKRLRYTLLIASLILLGLTLARPQYGFTWQEATKAGIDIVIAVDTSKSMNAVDIQPNRLERSKMAIIDLVSRLKGDRVALVPFAGTSFVMTPFTADYDVFTDSVQSLHTSIIPKGGTNLSSAIVTSEELFEKSSAYKILLLITDGEDLARQGIKEAEKVKEEGVQVYTIGVGTPGGDLIPDPNKPGHFLKDKKGNVVKSRLDEDALKNIASITGGEYRPITSGGNGLIEIYNNKLDSIPKEEKTEQMTKIPRDRFQWFLIPAVLFLLIEFFLLDSKKRQKLSKKQAVMICFMVIISLPAFSDEVKGSQAYREGNYSEAVSQFTLALNQNRSPQNLYNLGASYYKEGKYSEAQGYFNEAIKNGDVEMQKRSYFNQGNAYYKMGENAKDPKESIEHWEKALTSFEGAMALDNQNDAPRKNYDFVKEKLDELKKQQEEQKDQENQDQENQDQENQDQENQDQENQDQESQDQESQDQESQDQESQDQESQDQESQDQESQDQESQDQESQDQENQNQESQDQQDEEEGKDMQEVLNSQEETVMTEEQAQAILDSMKTEEDKLQMMTTRNDGSYTGEW